MQQRTWRCVGLALASGLLLLVACEGDVPTVAAPAPAPAPQAEKPAETGGQSTLGDRNSSLAGAKRAAENTVDKLEQRQSELSRQLDDIDEDG